MLLKYALGEDEASLKIDNAIKKALEQGYRTADLSAYGAKRGLLLY